MKIFKYLAKSPKKSSQWNKSGVTFALIGFIAFGVTSTGVPQVLAQIPPVPELNRELEKVSSQLIPTTSSEIARGTVRLDGRKLFLVATPATGENDLSNNLTPLEQRIDSIEDTLNNIVESEFNPETLQVTSKIDQQSQLPVISVVVDGEPSQYLLTVTTLDAQIYGTEPQMLADQFTEIIEEALLRAQAERQSSFLLQQGLIAGGLILGAIAASLVMLRVQKRLKAHQDRLASAAPTTDITGAPTTEVTPDSTNLPTVQHQMTKLQQHNITEIQRRLLQVGQVTVWGGTTFTVLGLFPYTRWLRPLIITGLQVPLKVIGIAIATYLVIRLSAVLIDRFFVALEQGQFLDPEASQRAALRFSTFSRVFKSITAVTCFGIAVIGILAAVGVNVAPLLAGAGIIGLGISLASQSLIKDTINGFFILLEDQYAVGDVIAVGTVSGFVENMNLRITQLRNAEGRLITIPNSAITIVENLSKDWSRVDVAIDVAYASDADRALSLIDEVAQTMSKEETWKDRIIEPPQVLGIDQLSHTGILVRVWIKTKPLEQWSVGREFRRRLKIALDREGISIGVPQQSLSLTTLDRLDKLAHSVDGQKSQVTQNSDTPAKP